MKGIIPFARELVHKYFKILPHFHDSVSEKLLSNFIEYKNVAFKLFKSTNQLSSPLPTEAQKCSTKDEQP